MGISSQVSAYEESFVRLWNVKTGEIIKTLEGHTENVDCAAFSPDGKTIATSARDKTVRLWNVRTGRHVRTITDYNDSISSLVYSPDGKKVIIGGEDSVQIWDVETRNQKATLYREFGKSLISTTFRHVAINPDGSVIASGSWDGRIHLWDAVTGQLIKELGGHIGNVYQLAFSQNGKILASCSSDGTILLFGQVWKEQ